MKKLNFDLGTLAAIGLLLVLAAWSPDARWSVVYLISAALAVRLFFEKFHAPKLGLGYYAIYVVCVFGAMAAWGKPGHYYFHIIDWLSFAVIALAGFNLTNEKKYGELRPIFRVNKWATVICVVYGLFQFYAAPEKYPVSILLHQNMTSQFLGFSLILQVASGSFFLVGATLAHLYFLGCRSIMIGLAFVTLLFVIRNKRVPYNNIKAALRQIGTAVAIILVMTLSQTGSFTKGTDFKGAPKITGKDRDIRMIRWENTVKMIINNPMGIGPGNFEWNYARQAQNDPEHQPRLNIRSPHNGYLELALEWGIPAACIFLILVFYIWRRIYSNELAFSIMTLFMVDAIFSFPMEMGFPFYVTAFFLGWGMKYTIGYGMRIPKWVIVPVIIMISSFGLKTFTAELWEENKTVKGLKRACELKPQDWQACLNYGVNLLKQKKFAAANQVFDAILEERPNMHPAILMNYHALKGLEDKKRMSQMIWRYKQIMPEDKLK